MLGLYAKALILLLTLPNLLAYSCINPNGQRVDWYKIIGGCDFCLKKWKFLRFVAYKLPDLKGATTDGRELLYADSSTSSSWLMDKAKVGEKSSAIGRTVMQLFQAKKQKAFLDYWLDNKGNPPSKPLPNFWHKRCLDFDFL